MVFINKCITGSAIVNQCMEFNHTPLVMVGTCNNEVISIHFILINHSKTKRKKFIERTCQFHVCAVIHGTSSFAPNCRKEGQHVQPRYGLPQGLSALWRYWTGRELLGSHFYIAGVHRGISWGMLVPHGQSPHSTSITLLESSFSILQVLRFFSGCWGSKDLGVYL
jgi:hypothetical protein